MEASNGGWTKGACLQLSCIINVMSEPGQNISAGIIQQLYFSAGKTPSYNFNNAHTTLLVDLFTSDVRLDAMLDFFKQPSSYALRKRVEHHNRVQV